MKTKNVTVDLFSIYDDSHIASFSVKCGIHACWRIDPLPEINGVELHVDDFKGLGDESETKMLDEIFAGETEGDLGDYCWKVQPSRSRDRDHRDMTSGK